MICAEFRLELGQQLRVLFTATQNRANIVMNMASLMQFNCSLYAEKVRRRSLCPLAYDGRVALLFPAGRVELGQPLLEPLVAADKVRLGEVENGQGCGSGVVSLEEEVAPG